MKFQKYYKIPIVQKWYNLCNQGDTLNIEGFLILINLPIGFLSKNKTGAFKMD